MSHKALITFPDDQYERLRLASSETGAPVAELVRRAVANSFGGSSGSQEIQRKLVLLEAGSGLWKRESDPFEEIRAQWPTPSSP